MKILVRGTNWIGDAVMSIPALRELRRIFPDASISLHTRTWADGLFRDASFIDELVTFDKNKWKIKDVYDNSQFLRDDNFDLAVILPNSFESALTSYLTRIPRRIGYNKDLRGLLLTDPIAVPEWKNRRHEVFYYLHLVAKAERLLLGRETVGQATPDINLEVSEDRKKDAKEKLLAFGVDTSRPIIALGIGSKNSDAKRWPADRYARLADKLQAELGTNVILIGSKEETEVAAEVEDAAARRLHNIAGKTDLDEVVGILASVDLLISNDMGLAHVAPAVGTKTIVIFGPTNPVTTRPFSDNAIVLTKEVNLDQKNDRSVWVDVEEVFDSAEDIFVSRLNSE